MIRVLRVLIRRRKSERLNNYQLKSLANICFDLAKLLGIAPIAKLFEKQQVQFDKNTQLVLLSFIVVFSILVAAGVYIGRNVKEE